MAGGIVPYPGSTLPEIYAARRRSHSQEIPLTHPERPFAMTPNLAFRKEVLYELNMFDSRFPGGGWEDADICWRFSRLSAMKLVYEPKAIVFHRYRNTYIDYFVQHYRYGYGRALIYSKYGDELVWKWYDIKRSLMGIFVSSYHLMHDIIKLNIKKDKNAILYTHFLEFIRNMGQISGFMAASLNKNKFEGTSDI